MKRIFHLLSGDVALSVLGVTLLAGMLWFFASHQQSVATDALATNDGAHHLLVNVLDQETSLQGFQATGDIRLLEPYARGRRTFDRRIFANADDFTTLLIARAVMGIGISVAFMGALKSVVDFVPREKLPATNSLIIATVTSLVSTVLGTMAGFAMHRYKSRALPILVLAPIAIPEILMGVSLLLFFVLLNFTLGIVSATMVSMGLPSLLRMTEPVVR